MTNLKLGLIAGGIALFTSFALTSTQVQADTVRINQQSQQNIDTPRTGQSMQQVEANYGEPVQRVDAVGIPPITRWVYNGFTVYFEHDKVIHAVIHHS